MLIIALALLLPASPLPTVCEPGTWQLGGAHHRVREEATFQESWRPPVDKIAACLAEASMSRACVRVQGQYDELTFGMSVVSAYGSTKAAQSARALGRSSRVVAELLKRDVPTHKIEELPPSDKPTFRGVSVTLLPDCLATAVSDMKQEATKVIIREEIDKAIADSRAAASSEVRQVIAEQVAKVDKAVEALETRGSGAPPAAQHHLAAVAGIEVGVASAGSNPGLASLLRIGAAWRWKRVSTQIDIGLLTGTPQTRQLGTEMNFAAGSSGVHWPWLWLGGVVGYRGTSVNLASPWLERGWYGGVRASEKLAELYPGGWLHLQQSAALGQLDRYGTVLDGQVYRIPHARELLLRFGIALALQHQLF